MTLILILVDRAKSALRTLSCFTKSSIQTREVTLYTKELRTMTKNNSKGTFCSFLRSCRSQALFEENHISWDSGKQWVPLSRRRALEVRYIFLLVTLPSFCRHTDIFFPCSKQRTQMEPRRICITIYKCNKIILLYLFSLAIASFSRREI